MKSSPMPALVGGGHVFGHVGELSIGRRWPRASVCLGIIGVAALGLAACHGDRLVAVSALGYPNRTISVALDNELDIMQQTVGPGEYASPPAVSSPAVQFLDVSLVGEPPAGPTQRVRFKAFARGRAIIVFRHTGQDPVVEDTVDVH